MHVGFIIQADDTTDDMPSIDLLCLVPQARNVYLTMPYANRVSKITPITRWIIGAP